MTKVEIKVSREKEFTNRTKVSIGRGIQKITISSSSSPPLILGLSPTSRATIITNMQEMRAQIILGQLEGKTVVSQDWLQVALV